MPNDVYGQNLEKIRRLKQQFGATQPAGINPEIAAGDAHLQNLQAQDTARIDAPTKPKSPMISRPVQLMKAPQNPAVLDQIRKIYNLVPKNERDQILGNPTMSPETKLQQLQTLISKRDPNLFGESNLKENLPMALSPEMKQLIDILQKNPEMVEKAGQLMGLQNKNKMNPGAAGIMNGISPMGESKKFVITNGQLVEAIYKGIVLHEKKKFLKEALVKEIRTQIYNKQLTEHLLTEGPLSNVWDKLKTGAGKLVSKFQNPNAFDPSSMMSNAEDEQKLITQRLTKLAAEAVKLKQKFTGEALKNAELINKYHDTVVALYQTWSRFKETIVGQKMHGQILDIVGGLHDDLKSEKDQLDLFIQNLGKSTDSHSIAQGKEKQKQRAVRTDKERESLQRIGKGYGFPAAEPMPLVNKKPVSKKQKIKLPPQQKPFDFSKIKSIAEVPPEIQKKMTPADHEAYIRNLISQVRQSEKPKRKRTKKAK